MIQKFVLVKISPDDFQDSFSRKVYEWISTNLKKNICFLEYFKALSEFDSEQKSCQY